MLNLGKNEKDKTLNSLSLHTCKHYEREKKSERERKAEGTKQYIYKQKQCLKKVSSEYSNSYAPID